jgi:hypothetical protein
MDPRRMADHPRVAFGERYAVRGDDKPCFSTATIYEIASTNFSPVTMFMQFNLDCSIEILSRTPAVLESLLYDLPDDWTRPNEGTDTWSPFDILGHMVHGEKTDWIPRAMMILEHGESRTFDPFDRFAMFEEAYGKSVEDLLHEFAVLRQQNIEELRGMELTPELLARRGTHPEFGAVTLAQLLATWVVHDLGHIAQITRVMAKQYTEAVGPWKAYLSVLTR